MVKITVGSLQFRARLEDKMAPKTVAAFRKLLPIRQKLVQARWSGQAAWVPLGDLKTGLGPENATTYPGAGELLIYPGGVSETEILFPYGQTAFGSKAGPLAGNHFATIEDGREHLSELGRRVLWDGAQDIVFEEG
ncbi:MAG: DUF3830 family protein [Candidatus Dormibacteraeota bacterium]|nr:DUF3830 family protein [Candidatus Dormibacteraeota bacterium]